MLDKTRNGKSLSFEVDDEGVSPVIGVILMVAITVIIASVVGAYVLDMGNMLKKPVKADVTIDEKFHEGSNSYSATIIVTDLYSADYVVVQTPGGGSIKMSEVGESVTLTGLSEGENIIIVGVRGQRKVVIERETVGFS